MSSRLETRQPSLLGMGGHHRGYRGDKDEWLTPPSIVAALGPFDLDPCSPINRPWPTASQHFTIEDDGLVVDWPADAFVWMNSPYGPDAYTWLERLAGHTGGGIALIFARTETEGFFSEVWGKADALLFVEGRLHFHHVNGDRAEANSGAPSVLIGYGQIAADRLQAANQTDKIRGQYIAGWRQS